MAGESILIVEDNPTNLKLAQILLKKHGYHILTATDADEALILLKDFHPSLILMDLQLPGMDGFQLTKLLKNNPQTKDILIIALTAYAMKGDKDRALNAGCDGYITKPFDTRGLSNTIEDFLRNSK